MLTAHGVFQRLYVSLHSLQALFMQRDLLLLHLDDIWGIKECYICLWSRNIVLGSATDFQEPSTKYVCKEVVMELLKVFAPDLFVLVLFWRASGQATISTNFKALRYSQCLFLN